MGLFNKIFGNASNAKQSAPTIILGKKWNAGNFVRNVHLPESGERTMYTYDFAPFDNLPDGAEVIMHVLPYEFSSTDGNEWNDAIALSIDGVTPCAAASDPTYGLARFIYAHGYTLTIKAVRRGTYNGVHADMKLMCGSSSEEAIKKLIFFDNENADRINLWVDDSSANFDFSINGVPVDLTVEQLPVKEKSKAKPHMLVKYGDYEIIELNANSSKYKPIAKHPNETLKAIGIKYDNGDGSVKYKFIVHV